MRVTSRFALLLGASLTLSACSARSPESAARREEPAYVRITNQSWLDMTVYVLRSSERIRLGMVNGNQTQRFAIPRNLVFHGTPLRFMADPIGSSRTAQSFEISVSPGDEVMLTIPPAP